LISSFDKCKAITTKIEQERSTDSRIGRSNAMGLSYAEGQQLFEESMVHLNAMIDYIEILSTKESEYVDQVQDQAMLKQVFLLVLALVTCILIAILFPRVITRDLNQINERFTDLAEGGGDLTVRFNTKRTDELGRLSNSFDRFMDKLHSLISEIVHTSDGVGSTVGELNSMSKQAKTSISQQDDSINSVAVAVEKMREALKGIAANTATTADEAKNSQHCTEDGRLLVEQTRSDIQCLTDDVQQVYKAMTRIETGTERIGSVLAVISGIAEQTNLLALNAAIEAARAGEQGRGFAVVADEVRSLASKTQQSTKDINDMIAELENSVSIAVKTMDSAIENAEKTLDSSMKTSESIQEIQASFVKVQNLVGETAKSTEQQYKIIETINGNISAINELSTVSADRAGKVEGSSRRLHQLYQELLQTTNKFKV
jgi:methyl-accepting chemotaxis protein